MTSDEKVILSQHPCFNHKVSRWFTRLHLPVATCCNIRCRYCSREYDCVNENRPGVASRPLPPRHVLKSVYNILSQDERIRVIGVAGPGEPLASNETIDALKRVHERYPHIIKCVSTNGLMLEDSLDQLESVGVKTITVTVNAVDPIIGSKIYSAVFYNNKPYQGIAGAKLLLNKQLAGIREARKRGMLVKVNTVLIPGINHHHLNQVAIAVKEAGAFIMNLVPFFPQAEFTLLPATSDGVLDGAKHELEPIIRQTKQNYQCFC
ncbi:MAG: FeMo cofactor biosynthesis protein NifB [Pelotomaculum sp. PtaB.Bin013]|nr:MAG: FeMo cofactor biosynthesis protein NifB [Pelotomaculum sp. PtaB.Bin013]